jgi:hypothetical protein
MGGRRGNGTGKGLSTSAFFSGLLKSSAVLRNSSEWLIPTPPMPTNPCLDLSFHDPLLLVARACFAARGDISRAPLGDALDFDSLELVRQNAIFSDTDGSRQLSGADEDLVKPRICAGSFGDGDFLPVAPPLSRGEIADSCLNIWLIGIFRS